MEFQRVNINKWVRYVRYSLSQVYCRILKYSSPFTNLKPLQPSAISVNDTKVLKVIEPILRNKNDIRTVS